MLSTWAFPTKIIFGAGAIGQVAEVSRDLGIQRPLIVTDPGIVKCGLVERLTGPLKKAGIAWSVFDRVEGNPTEASVLPGVEGKLGRRYRPGRRKRDRCRQGDPAQSHSRSAARGL